MSFTVQFELPDGALAGLGRSPEDAAAELRLAAAVKWFETGRVSQGRAAEIAGLSRDAFHDALARYDVSAFQLSADELREELRTL